jgi:hypothetical protein
VYRLFVIRQTEVHSHNRDGESGMIKLLLATLLIAVTLAATAATYTCQIDHSALYPTGQTRTDPATGALLWEYKCPIGHTYWIAPNAGYTAPVQPPATPAPQPDYSYLHNAGKQQMENTGSGLAALVAEAGHGYQPAKVSVILKCNHYYLLDVAYTDGSIKVIDDPRAPSGRNEAVDRDKLNALVSSIPGFSWRELPCDAE